MLSRCVVYGLGTRLLRSFLEVLRLGGKVVQASDIPLVFRFCRL